RLDDLDKVDWLLHRQSEGDGHFDRATLVVCAVVADLATAGTEARHRHTGCERASDLVIVHAAAQSPLKAHQSDAVGHWCGPFEEERELELENNRCCVAAIAQIGEESA